MRIEDIQFVPLTQGKFAIIDYADREDILAFKWYFSGGYAVRTAHVEQSGRHVLMHRVILGTPEGLLTDHVNGNKLDNRRGNLRVATPPQNVANGQTRRNNTSGFQGVFHRPCTKGGKPWRAYIRPNGKQIALGHFFTAEEAARAYDAAAREIYGKFARLNFPDH